MLCPARPARPRPNAHRRRLQGRPNVQRPERKQQHVGAAGGQLSAQARQLVPRVASAQARRQPPPARVRRLGQLDQQPRGPPAPRRRRSRPTAAMPAMPGPRGRTDRAREHGAPRVRCASAAPEHVQQDRQGRVGRQVQRRPHPGRQQAVQGPHQVVPDRQRVRQRQRGPQHARRQTAQQRLVREKSRLPGPAPAPDCGRGWCRRRAGAGTLSCTLVGPSQDCRPAGSRWYCFSRLLSSPRTCSRCRRNAAAASGVAGARSRSRLSRCSASATTSPARHR